MRIEQPLWLASRSPRRRQMLIDAGFNIRVQPPDIDDGVLQSGRVSPAAWVMALAYLKARRVADLLRFSIDDFSAWSNDWADHRRPGTVLGADTVCVCGPEILGQPRDADDARRMLKMLRDGDHHTLTGVCLLSLATATRIMFFDQTLVRVGKVSNQQIETYISSEDWRGKAGAYNLSERIAASWPIEHEGDSATVMGLPMERLRQFTIDD